MARPPRIAPKDIPQHVIQRGNNRITVFKSEDDYIAYVSWLKRFAEKFCVDIHAWVLMTNHVHLLCTPRTESLGISLMMQSLGRMYVRYFNEKYERTGTLWEGRYKSCLVNSESYLLTLYRYIELNPVRANMVSHPSQYKWSSYAINALGKSSSLQSPHPLYLLLGQSKVARLKAYQALFEQRICPSVLADIRRTGEKELVLGPESFKNAIAGMTDKRVKSGHRGRPRKN